MIITGIEVDTDRFFYAAEENLDGLYVIIGCNDCKDRHGLKRTLYHGKGTVATEMVRLMVRHEMEHQRALRKAQSQLKSI